VSYFVILIVVIALILLIKIQSKKAVNAILEKKEPLTKIEQVAYWRLVEAVGSDKIVLPQVAFSSFLVAKGERKAKYALFGRVRQKVADFVICNKDFSIHAIVEVDDKTHNKENDAKRDEYTEQVGIKTYRIEAKQLPSIEELRNAIL
jgi:hypothetical protein